MNSGMYSALSGSLAAMRRLDIISNNLANINTAGFKKDKMSFESLLASAPEPAQVPQSTTADPILQKDNVFVEYSAGPMHQTGNVLDVSIAGDGFFTVQTPEGPAYTRQGNFRLSADGTLVNLDGLPVLAQGGREIRITGNQVTISAKGEVSVDGAPVATIGLVDFPQPYNLKKTSGTLFVPADPQVTPGAAKGEIIQGSLEGSNVDSISEMVQLIETNRYFEACQKVIRGFDDMASKAANEIGRM